MSLNCKTTIVLVLTSYRFIQINLIQTMRLIKLYLIWRCINVVSSRINCNFIINPWTDPFFLTFKQLPLIMLFSFKPSQIYCKFGSINNFKRCNNIHNIVIGIILLMNVDTHSRWYLLISLIIENSFMIIIGSFMQKYSIK